MMISGVVPTQRPRTQSPAIAPSRTRRAPRAAGNRSTPRRPRVNTGHRPVPCTRSRTQGRRRGSSIASCRRRTITVRRSWRVAANRSWPTSVDRRSAASRLTRPISARPARTTATANTMGSSPETWNRRGHSTSSPNEAVGLVAMAPTPSAMASDSRTRPISEAAHRGSRVPAAISASPADNPTRARPATTPVATHASVLPGSRLAAMSPAIPPTTMPTKPRKRSCLTAGARSAIVRSTGARRTCRTSDRSSASGPPRLPERSPSAMAKAATSPIHPGPSTRTWITSPAVSGSSPTMLDRTAMATRLEDPREVGLVERVDPVDVRGPLLPAEPPPVLEIPLQVGVGMRGGAQDRGPTTAR